MSARGCSAVGGAYFVRASPGANDVARAGCAVDHRSGRPAARAVTSGSAVDARGVRETRASLAIALAELVRWDPRPPQTRSHGAQRAASERDSRSQRAR